MYKHGLCILNTYVYSNKCIYQCVQTPTPKIDKQRIRMALQIPTYTGKFDGGKFNVFGKLSMVCQSNYVVLTINNLLADLLPHQTFFCQMLKKSQFPKLSPCQTFPLYSITHNSSASKIVWQLATVRMCIHLPTYLNIHKPHISQFK